MSKVLPVVVVALCCCCNNDGQLYVRAVRGVIGKRVA